MLLSENSRMSQEAKQGEERVEFVANPTQRAFIESRAEADLFACRMGEGKTASLAWCVFFHTADNPGAVWALVRDTWENMRQTTQKEFFEWFPPGKFGTYLADQRVFRWYERTGIRGEVQFLGMDDPGDASKLQSRMLGGVGFDEPAPAAQSGGIDEFIFDVAISRLRQKGMKWYGLKLATNNPDETHWTYRRFKDPGYEPPAGLALAPRQQRGFQLWQPREAENEENLPPGYYEGLKAKWTHRPDLVSRFAEGKFGFQQHGKKVTPAWSDDAHLVRGLKAIRGIPLDLIWDGGLNSTCTITQVSPLGVWNILECHVGDGDMGAYELIEDAIRTRLATAYRGFSWRHTGDPSMSIREQSSARNSAVRVIRRELGGRWRPAPKEISARIDPLNSILRKRTTDGSGRVQVDREKAKAVWYALRGGWHYDVGRTGVISEDPVKDIHSHPGDTMGYGAAILFPLGELRKRKTTRRPQSASYFGRGQTGLGIERPGARLPKEARTIGD